MVWNKEHESQFNQYNRSMNREFESLTDMVYAESRLISAALTSKLVR